MHEDLLERFVSPIVVEPRELPHFEKRALDLFSGSGSVGQRLSEWGYSIVSVDNSPAASATHTVDILRWPYRKLYPPGYFDIVAAGVPCQEYSRAKTVGERDLELADKIVRKTLEIIQYLQPPVWWIENPRFGLLTKRAFMNNIPYIDLDYCQFSEWGYQKPTRFWCSRNISHLPNKVCDPAKCPNVIPNKSGGFQHRQRLGGNAMIYTTKQKGQTPKKLTDYLMSGFTSETPPPLHACDLDPLPRAAPVEWDVPVEEGLPASEATQVAANADELTPRKGAALSSGIPTADVATVAVESRPSGRGISVATPMMPTSVGQTEVFSAEPQVPPATEPPVSGDRLEESPASVPVSRRFDPVWYPPDQSSPVAYPQAQSIPDTCVPQQQAAAAAASILPEIFPHTDFSSNWFDKDVCMIDEPLSGDRLKLTLRLPVKFPDQEIRVLNALVDTGCEVSLISSKLCPPELFHTSLDLIRLRSANGSYISGGSKAVRLTMYFRQEEDGVERYEDLAITSEFYLADLRCDCILSFQWLQANRIGVFPDLGALALRDPFVLLFGERKHKSRTRPIRDVNTLTNASQSSCPATSDMPVAEFIPGGWVGTPKPPKASLPECPMWMLLHENWKLPPDGNLDEVRPQRLSQTEHAELLRRGLRGDDDDDDHDTRSVLGIEVITKDNPDPAVQKYVDMIHERYDGDVLAHDIHPDPPVRGIYGYAHIPLKPNATPTHTMAFQLHGPRFEAFKIVTANWLKEGLIERPPPGCSVEWLSPAFVVPKKSADFPWRGVVDMRGPNSQTRRCSYPLPRIDDLLVKHGAGQMFSVLDLRQAFHQQPLHPDSRPITATHTTDGVYQWKVNIMGLTNAPQQFQAMIEDCLEEVRDIASAYIDDIIISTRAELGEDLLAKHFRDVCRVLDVLRKKFLIADIVKCKFFCTGVEFCGHILENGTRRPAPGRLRAIEMWERPTTISALRAFLGFTNYYSAYIHDYASLVHRLQDKLKVPRADGKKGSKVKITWIDEDEAAFQETKKRLCDKLSLQHVNPDKPFVLRCDASGYAIGATLEQLYDSNETPTAQDAIEGRTVPVAFLSRKLTGSQRNWIPRGQETYAIILALQKWETWIGFQPVLVLTDHKSIESWTKEVLDTPCGPVGRRARWHQILSKYDLSVGYCPGKDNCQADILSRWAYPASQALRDVSKHGSAQDKAEMEEFIREEKADEKHCMMVSRAITAAPAGQPLIYLRNPPELANAWIRGLGPRPVTARDPECPEFCVMPITRDPVPVSFPPRCYRLRRPVPSQTPSYVPGQYAQQVNQAAGAVSGAPPPMMGEEAGNTGPVPHEPRSFNPQTPQVEIWGVRHWNHEHKQIPVIFLATPGIPMFLTPDPGYF